MGSQEWGQFMVLNYHFAELEKYVRDINVLRSAAKALDYQRSTDPRRCISDHVEPMRKILNDSFHGDAKGTLGRRLFLALGTIKICLDNVELDYYFERSNVKQHEIDAYFQVVKTRLDALSKTVHEESIDFHEECTPQVNTD